MERRRHGRWRWVCLALALAGCAEDVVVGRYFGAAADGGGDGGGSDDGGALADGGSGDGGALADLQLRFEASTVVEADSGVVQWQVDVLNTGPDPALDAVLRLRWPTSLTFSVVSGCDGGLTPFDGGLELQCAPVDLASAGFTRVRVDVTAPAEIRASFIEALASSATTERSPADNAGYSGIITTPPAGPALAVNAPTFFDFESCFGTNIFSFAQCVAGSRVMQSFAVFPDGGFNSPDGGGLVGTWQLGHDGGSLVFIAPFRPTPGAYLGAATSATCADGVIQAGNGRAYAGAWRGCFR